MWSGGTTPSKRRFDDLTRRGGDHAKREAVSVDPRRQELEQPRNVVLQPHPAASLDQMLAPDASKLRIVTDEIGELAALLNQIAARQTRYFLFKARGANQFAQYQTRIVETERLVEIRSHQIVAGGVGVETHDVLLEFVGRLK